MSELVQCFTDLGILREDVDFNRDLLAQHSGSDSNDDSVWLNKRYFIDLHALFNCGYKCVFDENTNRPNFIKHTNINFLMYTPIFCYPEYVTINEIKTLELIHVKFNTNFSN